MPEAHRFSAGKTHCAGSVDVIKGPWESDDSDPRTHDGSRLTDQSSITVLANRDSAISAS